MSKRDPQQTRILRYLDTHPEGITTYEAFIYLRITKLSTRISEMIRDGHKFTKTPEIRKLEDGTTERIMRYRKVA